MKNFKKLYAAFLYATLIIYLFQKETQIQEGILTFLANFLITLIFHNAPFYATLK